MSVDEAIRKTLVFSVFLVCAGSGGCLVGAVRGDVPSVVMGAVAAACGVLLGVLTLLARRKGRS